MAPSMGSLTASIAGCCATPIVDSTVCSCFSYGGSAVGPFGFYRGLSGGF